MSLTMVPSLFPRTRSTTLEESVMTATYTFDIFCTLDGYGPTAPTATGAATGVSKAPSFSTTASLNTARSSGWFSEPIPFGNSCRC
jgi:hypothetical protein